MFITIKKRAIIAILICVLVIGGVCGAYFGVRASASPKPIHTIVIDAGHGGIDGGAVGKVTGVDESHINLEYAQTLKVLCENFGIGVTMTRSDMNGLYDVTASNKKRSDMERRRQIIESSNADLVVSIHMNSYPLPSAHGAQVFYAQGAESGKRLADLVQTEIVRAIPSARKTSSVGDYYMLNCTEKPSIIVECGFLSNPEEEKMLVSEEYRTTLCYSILSGILQYYDM